MKVLAASVHSLTLILLGALMGVAAAAQHLDAAVDRRRVAVLAVGLVVAHVMAATAIWRMEGSEAGA